VVQIEGQAWRTSRLRITDEFQRNRWLRDAVEVCKQLYDSAGTEQHLQLFSHAAGKAKPLAFGARDASQNDRLESLMISWLACRALAAQVLP
jgi:hypothetical protein